VTNLYGSVTSQVATLTVNLPTTATALTSVTNACPGTSVTFGPTTASGTGPFIYQWTKNGTNIPAANGTSYNIPSVTNTDAGTYCVIVTGTCNSVTNCATLTVNTN